MKTRYYVCLTGMSWLDHLALQGAYQAAGTRSRRTVVEAYDEERRLQARCKRRNGENSYLLTRILASDDRGRNFRHLTLREIQGAALR